MCRRLGMPNYWCDRFRHSAIQKLLMFLIKCNLHNIILSRYKTRLGTRKEIFFTIFTAGILFKFYSLLKDNKGIHFFYFIFSRLLFGVFSSIKVKF